jgi:hemerythrin superfamily protein
MKKGKLRELADSHTTQSAHGVVKLLLADHELMRKLMDRVKSQKATPARQKQAFRELDRTVQSHVKAEESTFLKMIKNHPKFKDRALEGYEEHRVHETIVSGIKHVRDQTRQVEQMKIFCEILEHHLDEEEEYLFPRFKKYAALSTRRKMGKRFLKVRKQTNTTSKQRGAARLS